MENRQVLKKIKELIDRSIKVSDFYDVTGLSVEESVEIFESLRRKGYRIFLYEKDGQTFYCNENKYFELQGYKDTLIFPLDEDIVRFVVCADLHLGNVNDSKEYITKMIYHCLELGIKSVIIIGDLIEGVDYTVYFSDEPLDRDLLRQKQLAYVNEILPQIPGITYYFVFGNHDYFSSDGISYDIVKELREKYGRTDIKVLGSEDVKIMQKNLCIRLVHGAVGKTRAKNKRKINITISGGSHVFSSKEKNSIHYEKVSTLSNVKYSNEDDKNNQPGFLTCTVIKKGNQVQSVHVQRNVFTEYYDKPVCNGKIPFDKPAKRVRSKQKNKRDNQEKTD